MMKKGITLILLFCFVAAAPIICAQRADAAPAGAKAEGRVTQGELAKIMVNVLGLYRFLPGSPTALECIEVLLSNAIAPADGWQPDKIVNRADLARVVILAMKRGDEVQNPDDPRSWITFLASLGVSIDTIGEASDDIRTMAEPVAPNVFLSSRQTDVLQRRTKFGEPDEQEYGTDVEFVANMQVIACLIRQVEFPPVPKPPVTPN